LDTKCEGKKKRLRRGEEDAEEVRRPRGRWVLIAWEKTGVISRKTWRGVERVFIQDKVGSDGIIFFGNKGGLS
jgi:hypothetical protein